jgi:type VI protein secretion system component VasF
MDQGPDEIRQVIEDTREDLAGTIEALGQKADVKARVTEKAQETTGKVFDQAHTVVDRVHEAVPEQVAPAIDSVTGTIQEAGRRAADPKNRTPVIAAVAVLVAVLVFVRIRRSRS